MSIIASSNFFTARKSRSQYQIERSLRFNSADSAYLGPRTLSTPTNNLKWTFSCWVKRTQLGTNSALLDAYLNGVNFSTFYFTSTNELQFYNILGGVDSGVTTTGVYRDTSAWYHVVFVFDSANATTADRAIIYVNGVRPAQTNPYGAVGSSEGTYLNNTYSHSIGRMVDSGIYLNGYLTETYLIDGQALTPSSFGETDTTTGVWKPKRYSGTYGTNGFFLKFADNSNTTAATLGKDSSGNGNNWTPNNFSVTAGAGNDSLIDTPTPYADGGNGRGNYATLNAIQDTGTLTNGNLSFSGTSGGYSGRKSTIAIPSTGKWYWETNVSTQNTGAGNWFIVGMCTGSLSLTAYSQGVANSITYGDRNDMHFITNGVTTVTSSGTIAFSTGAVLQCAFDASTGKFWFGRDNTWWDSSAGTTGNPGAGTNQTLTAATNEWFPYVQMNEANNVADINFGQRAFAYTPPSGFLALNTQNLPEPTIKKPSSYMDVVTYTGTGSALTPTSSLGFSPDLVWIKSRSAATDHTFYDAVRGVEKRLESNNTDAEVTSDGGLTAFNSNGFTLGTLAQVNTNTATYCAWCWDESATPGFDIVSFASGTAGDKTFAHSLGVAPSFMIVKSRDESTYNWGIYHSSVCTNQQFLRFTTDARQSPGYNVWGTATPTSSVFGVSVSNTQGVVKTSQNCIAYLWSEVAGFSKFGSYTGNGSSDGPFVFCGFRPRWVVVKRTDTSGYDWEIFDSARGTYNVIGPRLWANLSSSETSATRVDFLSNGFKLRDSGGQVNGGTIVFAAFAESPFKYALAR